MRDNELDDVLSQLVEISKRYGKNPEYVLGDGGSAAQKESGILYIKDADKPLKEHNAIDFIKVDRNKLNNILLKVYPAQSDKRDKLLNNDIASSKLYTNDYRRVGINALLHNLMNYKYTLHIHPPLINTLACVSCDDAEAKRLIGQDLLFIKPISPGYDLVKQCRDIMRSYYARTGKHAALLLIQNHGVFLGADSAAGIDRQMLRVMSAVEAYINGRPDTEPLAHDAAHIGQLMEDIVKCYHDRLFAEFISNKRLLKYMANDTGKRQICPSNGTVSQCCGQMYMTLTNPDSLPVTFSNYVKTTGRLPRVILIPNVGAIAVGSTKNECRKAAESFMKRISAAEYYENFGGFLHMTDNLISHILNYDTPGMGFNL